MHLFLKRFNKLNLWSDISKQRNNTFDNDIQNIIKIKQKLCKEKTSTRSFNSKCREMHLAILSVCSIKGTSHRTKLGHPFLVFLKVGLRHRFRHFLHGHFKVFHGRWRHEFIAWNVADLVGSQALYAPPHWHHRCIPVKNKLDMSHSKKDRKVFRHFNNASSTSCYYFIEFYFIHFNFFILCFVYWSLIVKLKFVTSFCLPGEWGSWRGAAVV